MRLAWLIVVSGFVAPGLAQRAEPWPAPADVHLEFNTEDGQRVFHLGEMVPVTAVYRADVAGKYFRVDDGRKLVGGQPFFVSCSSAAGEVDPPRPNDDFDRFEEILAAPCDGTGSSGGASGVSTTEHSLDSSGLLMMWKLNEFARFRTMGTYTCIASAADVTTVPPEKGLRQALLLTSNPVALTIVDDPQWSHRAAVTYTESYERLCRSDDVVEHHYHECFNLAERIRYLDTRESLAAEVRMLDGNNHGCCGFWQAIATSSYPDDALRLMTSRIADADVEVAPWVLESLAVWDMKLETPGAFDDEAVAADYHHEAVEKLAKYVRLLGGSLGKKNADVMDGNVKTYLHFDQQEYCEGRPLIPAAEQSVVVPVGPS